MTTLPKYTPYYGGGQVQNPSNVIKTTGAPSTKLTSDRVGTLAVDNSTASIYGLASKSGGVNTWVSLGGGTNTFPITPFVVGPAGSAGYQTVQSALTAAGATGISQMVYVQPGTYTENLTFPDVNIALWGDRGGDSVIIGQHVPSAVSNLELHSLLLQSATNILNSSAAGVGSIEISDSFILVTNGFVFNLVNWTGEFLFDDCGEASTNDGVVNNTAGVTIKFLNTEMGAGSGQTMTLTGNANVRFDTCNVNCPVNIAGSGTLIFQNGCKFANTVTIGGSKTGTIVSSDFLTGANQSLVYNSSGNSYISGATVNSSNNPAIGGTGVGTLTLGDITFISNSSLAGTLTTAWAATKTGALTATGAISASTTVTAGTSITATAGAITATNGNLVLGTAGNKIMSTSVASTTTAGANSFGKVTLVSGTATIATTAVTANSIIMLTRDGIGSTGAAALGMLTVGTKSAGVSFIINALTTADATAVATTDVSSVSWMIIN